MAEDYLFISSWCLRDTKGRVTLWLTGDPRAHAVGHSWVTLGMLLCLCFLLITSAKFSHPIKV